MTRALARLLRIGCAGLMLAGTAPAIAVTLEVRESTAAGAAVAETVELYSNSYALVIGIDAYTGGWPRLTNAVEDAGLIAAAMEARGFEVTLATDLDSVDLKRTFEEFFILKGEDPEARLFVWYAGHGHSEYGEGFLVPVDAPAAKAGAKFRLKALSLRRFGEYVRMAYAKHAYTIFDTCFAGTIFTGQRSGLPPAITRATTEPVRQFLTSGDVDQEVSDDGTFRRLFLEALDGKRGADANADGYLTATEIGLFLSDSMTNYTENRQTPRYGKLRDPSYDQGDFIFLLEPPAGEAEAQAAGEAAAPAAEAPKVDDKAMELAFWNSVKDSGDPAAFEAYLTQYPEGTFAPLARLKVAKPAETQTAALTPAEPKAEAAPVEAEAASAPAEPEVANTPAESEAEVAAVTSTPVETEAASEPAEPEAAAETEVAAVTSTPIDAPPEVAITAPPPEPEVRLEPVRPRQEVFAYMAQNKARIEGRLARYLRDNRLGWRWLNPPYIDTFEVHDLNGDKVFADIAYKPDGGKPPDTRVTYRFELVWEGDGLVFVGHEALGE